jgi:hypothetical protein
VWVFVLGEFSEGGREVGRSKAGADPAKCLCLCRMRSGREREAM